MALTEEQINYIKNRIEYLLDFPTDETELKNKIKKLKEAFTNEVSFNHPFFNLRQCFLYPKRTLFGLEECAKKDSATIGEIQLEIIEIIMQAIAEVTNKTEIIDPCFDSLFESATKLLPKKNFETLFAHRRTVPDLFVKENFDEISCGKKFLI